MADRPNRLIPEVYTINPNTTLGITVTPGQYAAGLRVISGTLSIVNAGQSFAQGFMVDQNILGLNSAGTFYVATTGSSTIVHVLKVALGVTVSF